MSDPIDVTITDGSSAIVGRGYGDDGTGDFFQWAAKGSGTGVTGMADVGFGVEGDSQDGTGVYGYSDRLYGVAGQSVHGTGITGSGGTAGDGVFGTTGAAGMSGMAGIHTGNGHGVYGASTQGDGVFGTSTSGTGVQGTTTSGVGVLAESSSHDGNALEIQGAIKVAKASDGTPAPAFRFTVTRDNIYPSNNNVPAFNYGRNGIGAIIDHPLINGDPSVLLFVTPIATRSPGAHGFTMPQYPSVMYGIDTDRIYPSIPDKWVLIAGGVPVSFESSTVSLGDTFNILVIRTQKS